MDAYKDGERDLLTEKEAFLEPIILHMNHPPNMTIIFKQGLIYFAFFI